MKFGNSDLKNSRRVGICLGASGAVVALLGSSPPRLVALASVTWPYGLWQHPGGPEPGPAAVARKMLSRARRQLGLPRSCPASVVIGPSLSDRMPAQVLAGSAGLLAQSGLSQVWVTTTDRAQDLQHEVTVAPGALGAAAADEEAGLAIGAALARLAPAAIPAPNRLAVPDIAPDEVPDIAPDGVQDVAPDEVQDAAPDEVQDAAPDWAPDVTPDEVQDAAPDWAPDVAPDEVQDAAPEITPVAAAAPEVASGDAPGIWPVTGYAGDPLPPSGDVDEPAKHSMTSHRK
ncbi:MAG TPA: hypothetical protein VF062_21265 [Candidatus Limnocylindrales bacterium]